MRYLKLKAEPYPLAVLKGVRTILRREANGTVTVISLASTYTPNLSRQPDGTVNVS